MAGIAAPIRDLLTKLSAIQVVNNNLNTVDLYTRIWNNQVQTERDGKETVYPKPAAFVEVLSPANYDVIGQGYRSVDLSFRIHFVHEFYNTDGTFEQDLAIFDLRDKIIGALTGQKLTGCGPLNCMVEAQDFNHDNIYEYVMDFVCNFTDSTGSREDENNPNKFIDSEPPTDVEFNPITILNTGL